MNSQRPSPANGQTAGVSVRPTILLVEDDASTRYAFEQVLVEDGFEVILAANAAEALATLNSRPIDLVMTDVIMPDTDGFALCSQIRRDPSFGHIPVILLSARSGLSDRLAGIRVGADDYLTKPIDVEELSARILMHLRRSNREQQLNPITRLPGNLAIDQALQARLDSGDSFAVAYVDLDNFKAYNDRYGFHQGDEVIRLTGRLLATVVAPFRAEGAFVGHIGGDDFMVVAGCDSIGAICRAITSRFDEAITPYFNEEDRSRGYVVAIDRTGREQKFPFVSVSIGVVLCRPGRFTHTAELSQVATEVKSLAKKQRGSSYLVDRRNL